MITLGMDIGHVRGGFLGKAQALSGRFRFPTSPIAAMLPFLIAVNALPINLPNARQVWGKGSTPARGPVRRSLSNIYTKQRSNGVGRGNAASASRGGIEAAKPPSDEDEEVAAKAPKA